MRPSLVSCLLVLFGICSSVFGLLVGKQSLLQKVHGKRLGSSLRVSAVKGYTIAKMPHLNKGHSFSEYERGDLGLRGLYPCGEPMTLDTRVDIAMKQFRLKTSPIEKYQYLHTIQDTDETLFYAILTRHVAETMPIVYTPTVGEACQKWGQIYKHTPRGLYLSIKDKGQIRHILDNYPLKNIKAIVVTDGERILGLGDQGVNGMGIPVGKLALYTACAGVHPDHCLPVHIDVGTERAEYRSDPSYMGLRQQRVQGAEYDSLIDEFFTACQDKYGKNVLIQFEDFGNSNAFRLLDAHKNSACCFNDDIQGTASVVLAGLIASLPLTKKDSLRDHTFMFYGAGEAGVGIANMIVSYLHEHLGMDQAEAAKKVWLVDSKGLVSSTRTDKLAHHKQPYAHAIPAGSGVTSGDNLEHLVGKIKPSVLIGVSAQGGTFTEGVCKNMAKSHPHPVIFALSNPTTKAECTAKDAYTWTNGQCVFASGSPFDPVSVLGKSFIPGQGNNAYIFPGVGLGAIAAGARTLTDKDLIVAALSLAKQVTPERLATGCAYPPLGDIRRVSLLIAADVAQSILSDKRGDPKLQKSLTTLEAIKQRCADMMYEPKY